MLFKEYNQNDSRWDRVLIHPLCTNVPNVFTQILYSYKTDITNIENINSAIETGTYKGDTAEIFAEHFEQVYTVEKYITQDNNYCTDNLLSLYKNLRATHSNINFFSGDSPIFLKNILTENPTERFVILLDAHTHNFSPIIEELNSIKTYSTINNHVIIIDDAIDVGTMGWPSVQEFNKAILDINCNYKIIPTAFGRRTTLIYE
jgi:hypothetical protein